MTKRLELPKLPANQEWRIDSLVPERLYGESRGWEIEEEWGRRSTIMALSLWEYQERDVPKRRTLRKSKERWTTHEWVELNVITFRVETDNQNLVSRANNIIQQRVIKEFDRNQAERIAKRATALVGTYPPKRLEDAE